ncbi:hypothetical protein DOM21_09545 [Bacteriovorax stolpii]|uniref:Uncharacterized protein n=1 Tax=Bacteriovorax stolpii TaxID=960 RepID=A0A2K9NS32_BACTC|nr:hypothetical protein [Bacteriovorax stolpii]AUN98330.1 hypothetical protein C0V70_09475 [Bacteriovorax stolpii]QDK41690.1 hypothetical protein DOM21_09545 [Bacteriovorax stolpii]TDP52254.1 hypothetical protein C8D79_2905 [Bacteriovorax stolpii]
MKSFFLIILFIISSRTYATSCLDDIFSVNTQAKYFQNENILFYRGNGQPKRSNSSRKLDIHGKFKQINPATKCDQVTISSKQIKDEMGSDDYEVSLSGCSEITSKSSFYYMIDNEKKTISVSKPLVIIKSEEKIPSLNDEISKAIQTSSIYTSDRIDPSTQISKVDIQNITIKHFLTNKKPIVSVAMIELTNLSKYFNSKYSEMYPSEKTFSKESASFPVLFLTQNNLKNIGDGANCAAHRLSNILNYGQNTKPNLNLGEIYPFNLTDAYDLNNDGNADVLIIDQSFTYWIDNTGELHIIDNDVSC